MKTNTLPLPGIVAFTALMVVMYLTFGAAEQNRFVSGQQLVLATLISAGAGFALYHASFGFTAGWRRLVTEKRGSGVRIQFFLIGLTALVSFPMIGWYGASGFVQPVGVGLIVGSFLFGIGMQLGGGCGSGTLFVVGGGSTRMVITLFFFIMGSVAGVAHLPWWNALPRMGSFSLIREYGVVPALMLTFLVIGVLVWLTVRIEKSAHGHLEKARATSSLIKGQWSPWLGALALAGVGIATIFVLNRPWGITQAFGLWGAKMLYFGGLSTENWALTRWSEATLNRSVFASSTSVMNFGIILGAMMASSLAARWRPVFRLSFTEIWTAVIGGLLMGYGARLGYGCNIGAYLGGLISGSLHGWVWAVAAFAGSSLTARLRMKSV